MLDRDYVRLMAQYNLWMNDKLYALCGELSDEERKRDRGAFFKSIHGTLNHLIWADRLFLARLHGERLHVTSPGEILFEQFEAMRAERQQLDARLLGWAEQVPEGVLEQTFELQSVVYRRRRRMPTYLMVVQMFNHQTHHRGQLTTLLSQLGHDPGVTDLPFMPYSNALCEDLAPEGSPGG